MAPRIAALAQSESKSKFFQRLGMRQNSLDDRRLYSAMKVSGLGVWPVNVSDNTEQMEAAEGRKRLIDGHAP